MCDQKIAEKVGKLADVPINRPGFDALGMTAPILVQLNPEGKWENTAPDYLEEEKLKSVVQHLLSSKAIAAAQSYCCQCAAEAQNQGGPSNYVPIIMMPILPADQCPFDMDCEVQKMKESQEKKPVKKTKHEEQTNVGKKDAIIKPKKRGFVLQRFTDFDLISQW